MSSQILWLCVLVLLGVSFAGAERVSVMERDQVKLNTDVIANHHETIKWYFNDIQLVEITGDQSNICTGNDCKKIFGNRLTVDEQTGSLTITNTRTTDSGLYYLDIIDHGRDSEKTFNVTVNGFSPAEGYQMKKNLKERKSDSGLSQGARVGICVAGGALFVAAVAVGVIYCCGRQTTHNGPRMQRGNQEDGDTVSVPIANGHNSADTNDTPV